MLQFGFGMKTKYNQLKIGATLQGNLGLENSCFHITNHHKLQVTGMPKSQFDSSSLVDEVGVFLAVHSAITIVFIG